MTIHTPAAAPPLQHTKGRLPTFCLQRDAGPLAKAALAFKGTLVCGKGCTRLQRDAGPWQRLHSPSKGRWSMARAALAFKGTLVHGKGCTCLQRDAGPWQGLHLPSKGCWSMAKAALAFKGMLVHGKGWGPAPIPAWTVCLPHCAFCEPCLRCMPQGGPPRSSTPAGDLRVAAVVERDNTMRETTPHHESDNTTP